MLKRAFVAAAVLAVSVWAGRAQAGSIATLDYDLSSFGSPTDIPVSLTSIAYVPTAGVGYQLQLGGLWGADYLGVFTLVQDFDSNGLPQQTANTLLDLSASGSPVYHATEITGFGNFLNDPDPGTGILLFRFTSNGSSLVADGTPIAVLLSGIYGDLQGRGLQLSGGQADVNAQSVAVPTPSAVMGGAGLLSLLAVAGRRRWFLTKI